MRTRLDEIVEEVYAENRVGSPRYHAMSQNERESEIAWRAFRHGKERLALAYYAGNMSDRALVQPAPAKEKCGCDSRQWCTRCCPGGVPDRRKGERRMTARYPAGLWSRGHDRRYCDRRRDR